MLSEESKSVLAQAAKLSAMKPVFTKTRGDWIISGTDGDLEIAVSASGKVKVTVGDRVSVMPLMIAVAMMSKEVHEFLKSPEVLPFLYSGDGSIGKEEACRLIAARDRRRLRREWVNEVMASGLMTDEIEAFVLAKLKYPD